MHSGCLHEELRTHGGDRYSWRDARKAPHRLSHTVAVYPLVPGSLWTQAHAEGQQLDARPAPGRGYVVRALCELAKVLKRGAFQRKGHCLVPLPA